MHVRQEFQLLSTFERCSRRVPPKMVDGEQQPWTYLETAATKVNRTDEPLESEDGESDEDDGAELSIYEQYVAAIRAKFGKRGKPVSQKRFEAFTPEEQQRHLEEVEPAFVEPGKKDEEQVDFAKLGSGYEGKPGDRRLKKKHMVPWERKRKDDKR